MIDFYRSPLAQGYAPTGLSVPNYPEMYSVWDKWLKLAISEEVDARTALNGLAKGQEDVLKSLGYKLSPEESARWEKENGLKKKRAQEVKPVTVSPDSAWQ